MRAADIERYVRDYVRVSSWNRVKFDRLTAVQSHMHDKGIDCILLKGADLIPRVYGVMGRRPDSASVRSPGPAPSRRRRHAGS